MAEDDNSRAGHNGGGKLKSGNTKNTGRKPSEVRARLLKGFDAAIGDLVKIARGTLDIDVPGKDGENGTKRKPTARERIAAIEVLGKYGLGIKMDLTTGDEPLTKAYIGIDDSKM